MLLDRHPLPARVIASWVIGLAAVHVYTWIAVGVGSYFREYAMPLLGAGAVCIVAGLVAGVAQRGRLAQALWVGALLLQVPTYVAFEVRVANNRKNSEARHLAENEVLLANAEAKLACENGDTLVLQRMRRAVDEWNLLSLVRVPADRREQNETLMSTAGQNRPPMDDRVKAYVRRTGGRCSSAEYPDVDALVARIDAHYVAERPRRAKEEAAREAERAAERAARPR